MILFMASGCAMFFRSYNNIDDETDLIGWGKYQDIEKQLRIDGEYYYKVWDIYDKANTIYRITIYSNGIFHGFIGFNEDNSKDSVQYKRYLEYCKNNLTGWGSYNIINDSIFFHYIRIDGSYHVGRQKGEIGKDKKSMMVWDNYYQFDSTAHKPDSVTDLFKNKYLQQELKKGYEEYLQRVKK